MYTSPAARSGFGETDTEKALAAAEANIIAAINAKPAVAPPTDVGGSMMNFIKSNPAVALGGGLFLMVLLLSRR